MNPQGHGEEGLYPFVGALSRSMRSQGLYAKASLKFHVAQIAGTASITLACGGACSVARRRFLPVTATIVDMGCRGLQRPSHQQCGSMYVKGADSRKVRQCSGQIRQHEPNEVRSGGNLIRVATYQIPANCMYTGQTSFPSKLIIQAVLHASARHSTMPRQICSALVHCKSQLQSNRECKTGGMHEDPNQLPWKGIL